MRTVLNRSVSDVGNSNSRSAVTVNESYSRAFGAENVNKYVSQF
jgi:hypothetical protein